MAKFEISEYTISPEADVLERHRIAEADMLRTVRECQKTPSVLIGTGNSAEVYSPKHWPERLCVKVFKPTLDREVSWCRSGFEESRVTDVARKLVQQKGINVAIPRQFFSYEVKSGYGSYDGYEAILMERLPIIDLHMMQVNGIGLPKDFDIERYISDLRKATEVLNENKIYHRDLRPQNVGIMGFVRDHQSAVQKLNENNPMFLKPAIIDFGMAKETVFSDEDPLEDGGFRIGITDDQGIREIRKQLVSIAKQTK